MIQRLQHVISVRFAKENERVAAATYRLSPQQMKNQVTQKQQEQAYTTTRLMQAMTRVLMQKQQQANQTIQALDLLSPLKIMSRGYSYATSDTEIIRSVEQLNTNDHLTLHLADGQAKVDVRDVKKGQVDDPTDI